MSITVHIKSYKDWNINKQILFHSIDMFMQRCYDAIEICKSITLFGK